MSLVFLLFANASIATKLANHHRYSNQEMHGRKDSACARADDCASQVITPRVTPGLHVAQWMLVRVEISSSTPGRDEEMLLSATRISKFDGSEKSSRNNIQLAV